MASFDGTFALDYAYPLAAAAYCEPWNAEGNAVLAAFTNVGELLVDTTSPSFAASASAGVSAGSQAMLNAMRRPQGAGLAPSAATVAAAEGLASGTADADAPLPPVTVPGAAAPAAPAVPVDDRFGWVCTDPAAKRLIIAFRGTQTPGDWLNDFDFIPEPYRPLPNGGTVHQGFQHVYYAVRDNLILLVQARLAGITSVLIVGHSLGAALATLAMPDMLKVLANGGASATPRLYNFASPRAGHRDFENFFNPLCPDTWRIVNVWDVVPHVPPALAGYVHVGKQLTIDSGFSFDVARNHELATGYLPGLTAWVNKHPAGTAAALAAAPREVPPGVSD